MSETKHKWSGQGDKPWTCELCGFYTANLRHIEYGYCHHKWNHRLQLHGKRLTCCGFCGVVKNDLNSEKPCIGKVFIETREAQSTVPATEGAEAEDMGMAMFGKVYRSSHPSPKAETCPTCHSQIQAICTDRWHYYRVRPVTPQAEPGASQPRGDVYSQMEIDQARGILRSNAALIAKIQAIVHEHFAANGEPDERWSDYDVLDQGVAVALRSSHPTVPATEGAAPNSRWSDYAASEFGREEYAAWDAFYARMRAPILIEVFQQDWIPGFAAYYPSADYAAKPHVVLNIGSLMAAVDSGELLSKELPYMVAERLMHEVIHVLEHWANEEFSEEKVEGLIMKYRELAGRGESAEQEQNKAGGEGETLIISSSALDERPADLEISWCVGRLRPVTPQAEPGASQPPFLAEKIVELIYSKAMVTQRLCWSDQKEKMAAEVAALLAIPAAVPQASAITECKMCKRGDPIENGQHYIIGDDPYWVPCEVTQASAGLSDEEIARKRAEIVETYMRTNYDPLQERLKVVQRHIDAAIAEVRQRGGERYARLERDFKHIGAQWVKATEQLEVAEERIAELERERDIMDIRKGKVEARADSLQQRINRQAEIIGKRQTAWHEMKDERDSLAATLEKVMEYAQHRPNCSRYLPDGENFVRECNCGLDASLAALASLRPASGTEAE